MNDACAMLGSVDAQAWVNDFWLYNMFLILSVSRISRNTYAKMSTFPSYGLTSFHVLVSISKDFFIGFVLRGDSMKMGNTFWPNLVMKT